MPTTLKNLLLTSAHTSPPSNLHSKQVTQSPTILHKWQHKKKYILTVLLLVQNFAPYMVSIAIHGVKNHSCHWTVAILHTYHKEEEQKEVNVTRAPKEPALAVRPRNKEKNGKGGGQALVLPPKVFKGNRDKAKDFIQGFNLCWHLNHQHPVIKFPYNCIMLALSYIRGSTTI